MTILREGVTQCVPTIGTLVLFACAFWGGCRAECRVPLVLCMVLPNRTVWERCVLLLSVKSSLFCLLSVPFGIYAGILL